MLVLVYAVIPQSALDGSAGHSAVLHAIRHDLVPVVAFFLGRAVGVTGAQIRSVAWTILGTGAAVAGFGLIEEYTVGVGWWHRSGAVGYFRHQLGFDYHGPGGMPENFAFNTGNNHLFRRLISTFVSPLAAALHARRLAPGRAAPAPRAAARRARLRRARVHDLALGAHRSRRRPGRARDRAASSSGRSPPRSS